MSTSSWPSTPLNAAEKAFTMLAEAPTHVPVGLVNPVRSCDVRICARVGRR
jgi:hypothetical protein